MSASGKMGEPSPENADELVRLRSRVDELESINETLRAELGDRKRAEEALREKERETRLVVDNIAGLVAIFAPDGELLDVNQQFLNYSGRSFEEHQRWDEIDFIHPDDSGKVRASRARRTKSPEPYEYQVRLRRFDGAYRWFLNRVVPLLDGAGRARLWYVLVTDIDERLRAEEERKLAREALAASERNLRLIVDTMPALSWSARPDGAADFFNEHYLKYVGLSSAQAEGWGWTVAVHPDDMAHLSGVWQGALAFGTPSEAEARLRRYDGTYHWHLFRASPLRSENGNIVKWYGVNTNIEDRKSTEEKLRESERQARLIVDTIPGQVAVLSPIGSIEAVNPQLVAYCGKRAEQLKDWGSDGTVHPEDAPVIAPVFAQSLDSGIPYDYECRIRRFDGVYRWFQVRGLPLRDAAGRITRWYVLLTDVDDRKRAEQALSDSQRNLQLTVDTIPAFAWSGRPDGTAEFFNQHYLNYLGLTLKDVVDSGWMNAVHPDDLEGFVTAWEAKKDAGQPGEAEARFRRFDGEYRWLLSRFNPLRDESGEIVKWYGANIEIEQRKRAEAELRRAYDSFADAQRLSHTGSFITDLVGDDHNWSDETYRIFGFEPGSKVSLERIQKIIHPDDLESFGNMIARAMGGANVDFMFRIVAECGTKHIRGVAHVIEEVSGRPLFVGALQDITESKLAEEALNRTRSELAHVARVTALSTLTASIAHEVNQPLAGIITNANTCLRMLAVDPPNIDGARETVRRTLRDGNRASEVLTRLRALFTKKNIAVETVHLNEAAREVIALSLGELQRNGVSVRTDLAESLPPITGDRVQLQQVILNLLLNASDAVRAVDDRPRSVTVRTDQDDEGSVRLSVEDKGVGIDPDNAGKLFDAFYTTKPGGMGIGLSVSRSIIERHGGKIWTAANDGPGTTFLFSIPSQPLAVAGMPGGVGKIRTERTRP